MELALNNLQRLICHKTQPTFVVVIITIYLNSISTVIVYSYCLIFIHILHMVQLNKNNFQVSV